MGIFALSPADWWGLFFIGYFRIFVKTYYIMDSNKKYIMDSNKKKAEFLVAFEIKQGNISLACKACNVSRSAVYRWRDDDEDFRNSWIEVEESLKDEGESILRELMKARDTTAVIFYLKTKCRDRGYSERLELTGKNGSPIFESIKVEIVNGTADKGD